MTDIQLEPDHWGPRDLVIADRLFELPPVEIYRCLVRSLVQDEHGVAHTDAGLHYIILAHDRETVVWERPLYHPPHTKPVITHDDTHVLLTIEDTLHRIDPQTGFDETEEAHYADLTFVQKLTIVIPDFENISLELMEYLSKHPSDMATLDPRVFEKLLEAVFRNQGYQTELTPLSGDRGIDLRLWHKDAIGDIVTLVQAKRYSPSRPIGIEAVQALFGAVEHERANRGLFVTTSRYLPGVKEWTETIGRRISLATSKEVARWCKRASERRSTSKG